MGWIIVRNWDRFQHYGDRRSPPWIKLYLGLLHDDDFQSLSSSDRSALVSLWMLYAMTRRRVRDDTLKITRATGQRFTKATLERLNHAGFIDISASKPLALDVDVDVEEEKSLVEDLKPVDNGAPPRDPDAVEKIKALRAQIGLSL